VLTEIRINCQFLDSIFGKSHNPLKNIQTRKEREREREKKREREREREREKKRSLNGKQTKSRKELGSKMISGRLLRDLTRAHDSSVQRGAEFPRNPRTRFRTRARTRRRKMAPVSSSRRLILLENPTTRFLAESRIAFFVQETEWHSDSRSSVDRCARRRGRVVWRPTSREFEVSPESSELSTGAATQLSVATSSIAYGELAKRRLAIFFFLPRRWSRRWTRERKILTSLRISDSFAKRPFGRQLT